MTGIQYVFFIITATEICPDDGFGYDVVTTVGPVTGLTMSANHPKWDLVGKGGLLAG